MKPQTLDTIKQTIPVLQTHGEALTRLFYKNMFANNPEVAPFFNPAHQKTGTQQRALANAICAYAQHVKNSLTRSNSSPRNTFLWGFCLSIIR